jgi:hypothetical protein
MGEGCYKDGGSCQFHKAQPAIIHIVRVSPDTLQISVQDFMKINKYFNSVFTATEPLPTRWKCIGEVS